MEGGIGQRGVATSRDAPPVRQRLAEDIAGVQLFVDEGLKRLQLGILTFSMMLSAVVLGG